MVIFALVLSLWAGHFAQSQEPHIQSPSAKELYLSGVKSFQNSQFKEAADSFRMAFEKDPDNRAILFNWGLAEHRLGRIGMAAATWRRALALDPDFQAAQQALQVIQPKISSTNIEPDFFESFRASVLVHVSGTQLALLTALLLFASGWLLLRFIGQRRRALENEKPLPAFPALGLTFFVLFLFATFTSLSKVYDFFQPRATIVATTASVYSGPSDESPSLFELSEGFEVILNHSQGAWRQVTSPGGLSGWMKREALFQTSGRHQW